MAEGPRGNMLLGPPSLATGGVLGSIRTVGHSRLAQSGINSDHSIKTRSIQGPRCPLVFLQHVKHALREICNSKPTQNLLFSSLDRTCLHDAVVNSMLRHWGCLVRADHLLDPNLTGLTAKQKTMLVLSANLQGETANRCATSDVGPQVLTPISFEPERRSS